MEHPYRSPTSDGADHSELSTWPGAEAGNLEASSCWHLNNFLPGLWYGIGGLLTDLDPENVNIRS